MGNAHPRDSNVIPYLKGILGDLEPEISEAYIEYAALYECQRDHIVINHFSKGLNRRLK